MYPAVAAVLCLLVVAAPAGAASKPRLTMTVAAAPEGVPGVRAQLKGPRAAKLSLKTSVRDGTRWLRARTVVRRVTLDRKGAATVDVPVDALKGATGACARGRLWLRAAGRNGRRRVSAQRSVQKLACPRAGAPGVVPGAPAPPVYPPGGKLRWAPPALTAPTEIRLGNGFTTTKLDKSKDYVIVMPSTVKVGGTSIEGGRNVVIVGGHATVPATLEVGAPPDQQRRALYIKDATGTVHVEGMLIDGSGGGQSDGVAVSAPQAVVQLQNMRVVGLRGGEDGFHSDLVQSWGGAKELRIDRFTGSSNYQGLQIGPDLGTTGRADVSRVNMSSSAGPLDPGGYMVWLTRGSESCETTPAAMHDVYVNPRGDRPLGRSVWPPQDSSLPCRVRLSGAGLDWPGLPGVSGSVRGGMPPGGDYVPGDRAGNGYTSPG